MKNIRHVLICFMIFALSVPVWAVDTIGFHDEGELGAAVVSGNSNAETYNAKDAATYGWDQNLFKLSGRYLNTRTEGVDSARNWDTSLRYERVLSELFNLYAQYGLVSDVFAGYVQRNNADLGGKYFLAKSDPTTWTVELGYRNSVTQFTGNINSETSSSVRLYSEIDQTITKTASFKFWAEYVQTLASNFTNIAGYQTSQDYLFNVEPSVSVMFNDVFSLKAAYLFKYKSFLPPGSTATKYLDTAFTTSVVAKF